MTRPIKRSIGFNRLPYVSIGPGLSSFFNMVNGGHIKYAKVVNSQVGCGVSDWKWMCQKDSLLFFKTAYKIGHNFRKQSTLADAAPDKPTNGSRGKDSMGFSVVTC